MRSENMARIRSQYTYATRAVVYSKADEHNSEKMLESLLWISPR